MTIDPNSRLFLHHQQQRERDRHHELVLGADVPISRSGRGRSPDDLGAFGPRGAAIGRPSWWSRTERRGPKDIGS